MNSVVKVWGLIVLSIVVVMAMIYVVGGIAMQTAPFRGEVEEREIVEADGQRRVAVIERFYTLCGDIAAKETAIEELETLAESTADPDAKERYIQAVAVNRIQKREMIEDYNAAATNEETKGFLRDSELPAEIGEDQEDVECGSPE